MRTYDLYMNMKRWLIIFGCELLDLLFPVFIPESEDPMIRYDHLNELFDKHFNLMAYYQTQLEPDLPLILVSFMDLTGDSCFAKFRVKFDIYFQTISPSDCKDDRVNVINSPEAMLAYQQQINDALTCMICSMDDDLRHEEFDGNPWGYPINYSIEDKKYGALNGVEKREILHFQTSFDLSDNLSCC